MKKTVFLVSLLLLGLGASLTGCTPSPKAETVSPYEESAIPTAGTLPAVGPAVGPAAADVPMNRPHFGRFNIHKRHGLGGWEGNVPAASERELLRRLSGAP